MSEALPGLPKGTVFLTPPHPEWPRLFDAEARRIRTALGDRVLGLEHYGSTSIPGLKAKPVIDLLVGLARLEEADDCAATMIALGYEDSGDGGVPGHRIFGRGEARTHICHMVVHEGPEWRVSLAFRDALRANPALARDYEALKVRLAGQHASDRPSYTAGKGAFVEAIVRRVQGA